MHSEVGKQAFVTASLDELVRHLDSDSADVHTSIAEALGTADQGAIEAERTKLMAHFSALKDSSISEPSHRDVYYVSRLDGLGVFQSVLAKVFNRIPGLQGYGDRNPIWLVTVVEQGAYTLKNFFQHVHQDVAGKNEPLLTSILKEWKQISFERAPYPAGTPQTIPLAPNATVALLADWGGDNPAARHVVSVVQKNKPTLAIHLGDIYYGGIAAECETFLQLWPFQTNTRNPLIGIPPNTSLALNGNHEMYSGGESYSGAAVSMFAMLNFSGTCPELLIEYIDEDNRVWGTEVWDAVKGRLNGGKFQERDFDQQLLKQ